MKLFGVCFSAVFMICSFCPLLQARAPLRSELKENSSAIWTQINTTVDHIVEKFINGRPSYWNTRNGRITTDHLTSGNFSILIKNVQSSDLGLYHCELYRDFNCPLVYKEITFSGSDKLYSFSPLCTSAVFMICSFCHLLQARGHGVCQRKFIEGVNVYTELQSKILLPCLFDSAPFRSELNENSSAVWTQVNITNYYIVEIFINGRPSFWNTRNGRITTDHITSGNYSILIKNVQSSDLGLYRCELYRDSNCPLVYKEISLTLRVNNWQLMAAAAGGGGGFLVLCLIALCVYCTTTKRQKNGASVEHTSDNCQVFSGETATEVTYASIVHKSHQQHQSQVLANKSPANVSESEDVMYAAVKKRDN